MEKTCEITIIVALMASSLIIAQSVKAQSITKPLIPEFAVKYVDHSYDIPPTYGTDQYNGNTIITKQGEHIDNRAIEISIKNEHFTPFDDSNGNRIDRFYDVRHKGSYTENWTTMFENKTQYEWLGQTNPYMEYGYAVQDYSAQYTTIIYTLTWQVPTDGQIDFQVQALQGYTIQTSHDGRLYFATADFAFYGQESGWSNTRTIKIGESNPTATPNLTLRPPQPTPTQTVNVTPAPTENPTIVPQHQSAESFVVFGFALSLEHLAILGLSSLVVVLSVIVAVLASRRRLIGK